MSRRPPGGGAAAAVAAAVLGSLLWLLALVGGAVTSPTVWTVVGVGVGALLVSSAVRHGGRRGLSLPEQPREALGWRGYRTAGVLLAVVASAALVALVAAGPGAAALVLGGPGGVVLWVTSTALVAAAGPTAVGSRSRSR